MNDAVPVAGLARADLTLDELGSGAGTIVLVEGDSDAAAVATIAARLRTIRELEVLSAHGVTNYRHLLARLRADHPGRRVVGLYDAPEEGVVRQALERSGIGRPIDRVAIERLGFFACVADLEDEFIRAIGADRVEQVIDEQGELEAFRILQRQPAQRGRPVVAQLRRFMGTKSARKIRYGRLLAAAVDLDRCPLPLRRVVSGE
ncbi:MAG: hypothetical protein R8G01_20615 [Ilumatobacteraceae bacterium]|nr:hypothetical protein [Ilumatobacteraceae bacterium]